MGFSTVDARTSQPASGVARVLKLVDGKWIQLGSPIELDWMGHAGAIVSVPAPVIAGRRDELPVYVALTSRNFLHVYSWALETLTWSKIKSFQFGKHWCPFEGTQCQDKCSHPESHWPFVECAVNRPPGDDVQMVIGKDDSNFFQTDRLSIFVKRGLDAYVFWKTESTSWDTYITTDVGVATLSPYGPTLVYQKGKSGPIQRVLIEETSWQYVDSTIGTYAIPKAASSNATNQEVVSLRYQPKDPDGILFAVLKTTNENEEDTASLHYWELNRASRAVDKSDSLNVTSEELIGEVSDKIDAFYVETGELIGAVPVASGSPYIVFALVERFGNRIKYKTYAFEGHVSSTYGGEGEYMGNLGWRLLGNVAPTANVTSIYNTKETVVHPFDVSADWWTLSTGNNDGVAIYELENRCNPVNETTLRLTISTDRRTRGYRVRTIQNDGEVIVLRDCSVVRLLNFASSNCGSYPWSTMVEEFCIPRKNLTSACLEIEAEETWFSDKDADFRAYLYDNSTVTSLKIDQEGLMRSSRNKYYYSAGCDKQ